MKDTFRISSFIYFIGGLIMLISGCRFGENQTTDNKYVSEINEWHQKRIASLSKPTGWLSLAGLYWLEEGENTFGADSTNDIVFQAGKAPDRLGIFILTDTTVTVRIHPGVEVFSDGKPVREMQLKHDMTGEPTILSHGSLSWFVIKRGNQFGIRLRDSENPNIKNFTGIERYPVDAKWRVEATFEPYDPPKEIPIPNVLGTVTQEISPGALVFQIEGKTYRLDPILEAGVEDLFIIFSDQTNGEETYPAGRFVYAKQPGPDGKTIIDFNKAYNPPCAFSDYATCPLPPKQNHLPFRITAGEKNYKGNHH